MKRLLTVLVALLLLAGCTAKDPQSTGNSASSEGNPLLATSVAPQEPVVLETMPVWPVEALPGCSLYVKRVEDLPEHFIFGMDASQVPALERSGVKYYDFNGEEKDVFRILAENGVNTVRVRVWNDPFDEQGRDYGGGNCNVDTALEIGRRATRYGMGLLVDFHYSDFWADPGKQRAPKAWQDMDIGTKAAALEAFTHDVLMALRNAGVRVEMVQVGNETNGAMCGETEWSAIVKLMAAGSRAVRAVFPEAKVAVHFAGPEIGTYNTYAANLKIYELDYDVFGTSYYPYWHGTLENLTKVLKQVKSTTGKDVMVLETSYAWTLEDSDFSGNTISESSSVPRPYPYSLQGQVNSLRDVTQAVQNAGGIGVCYWEGTWIGVGTASKAENQKRWEAYGSGWATSYAADYDPDAGKWYGGDAVDNQAFFDAQGRALESLMAFNLIRFGNDEAPLTVQSLEDPELTVTAGDDLSLPETVDAVMTDNSRQSTVVAWDITQEAFSELLRQPGTHTIIGTALDMPVRLTLKVQSPNLLKNPSFEDGTADPWVVDNIGGCRELKVEQKTADSRTGDWHYHFWSAESGKIEFTLEQTPEALVPGIYDFSIHIMGGDCGAAEVFAYAKIDGEIVAAAPMEITVWNEWHEGKIEGISCTEGQILTVGICVKTDAAGAWGKIDDAVLTER